MEHLLKLSSLTPDEIIHILDVADEYKRLHKAGTDPKDLQGKAIALMFGKHSTRTPHQPGGRHLPDGRPWHLSERR